MTRVPFRVSARAARLIGRENVATSQGAVTELVKNTYDADASACAILFVRRYSNPPKTLSDAEIAELGAIFPDVGRCYQLAGDGKFTLAVELSAADQTNLCAALDHVLDLWIVDNGTGMSDAAIEDHWMVIGTDAKETNGLSAGGRVVTGAKGIGRFALDRLGRECELFSGERNHADIVHWVVDWGDFEGDGKIIDDVSAVIEVEPRTMPEVYWEHRLTDVLPKRLPAPEGEEEEGGEAIAFHHGTAIRISLLHDRWDARDSIKLKGTLEALLPPRDRGGFNIYVYDHREPGESGWIDNLPPDQFDYRLTARVKADGKIDILLERQEIDEARIRPTVFTLPAMDVDGFRQADFEKGSFRYETTLRSILNLKDEQHERDYLAIGPFEFTLYFMKLANPTSDNLLRYPQKSFDVSKRRRWLRQSGGIRLYRDQFRVRPYGEPNTQGSDWLLLGQRVAANPAAAKRVGWRVPPQQVAGTIHITKADNPLLSDQSNREGIMNERAFATFRNVILALIREFENDRSYILSNFSAAYEKDNPEQQTLDDGNALAEKILAEARVDKSAGESEPAPPLSRPLSREAAESKAERILLASALKSQTQRTINLEDNVQVLRGMATLGTVLVSFTHELKQIKANMEMRQSRMTNSLNRVVDTKRLGALPVQVNPFNILERWRREDEKISRWVDFALASVSPVKRRRRIINMREYLDGLVDYWREFSASREIELISASPKQRVFPILAHEIDLDSIFYNLIINSIEAFAPTGIVNRKIVIELGDDDEGMITLTYRDNGPGLSANFKTPDEIFEYGRSSKADRDDSEITGTGIGMWLLKAIIDDYQGRILSISAVGEQGFFISFGLPRKEGARIADQLE